MVAPYHVVRRMKIRECHYFVGKVCDLKDKNNAQLPRYYRLCQNADNTYSLVLPACVKIIKQDKKFTSWNDAIQLQEERINQLSNKMHEYFNDAIQPTTVFEYEKQNVIVEPNKEASAQDALPPTYVEGFHNLEAVKAMEYRVLGKTRLLVSKLSFGGGALGCHYSAYNENEAIRAIREAIKQGINYIDTAPWYGHGRSESVIGKALKGVPREAYYIATKVGRYELNYENMFDFTKQKTRSSFNESLKLLGLDYVDIIQVHDIEFAPSLNLIITQTLPELSQLVAEGKAKYIGITGYPVSILKECIERSNINISCVLSYARYNLLDESLKQYIPYLKDHNIGIINAALVCMGLLTNNGPPAWHPACENVKKICTDAREYCKNQGIELAKLALWHSMKYEDVATNLIGMQNFEELCVNLNVVKNGITEREHKMLQELEEKYFTMIRGEHWEGKELAEYWTAVSK